MNDEEVEMRDKKAKIEEEEEEGRRRREGHIGETAFQGIHVGMSYSQTKRKKPYKVETRTEH